MSRALLFALLGLAVADGAVAQTLLIPGQSSQFSLPGGAFTNDIAIDVPADAQQLRIELSASGGADVDLLLRYGAAFPVNGNAGVFGGVDWLTEHAHYRSISPGSSERVTVTRRQRQPLRAGRWHLSVINFANQASQVNVLATVANTEPGIAPISAIFDDSTGCASQAGQAGQPAASTAPWFDSTAATPVGGNPGTTLGEQRRNAFNRALAEIAEELIGIGALRIRACWRDLGGSANGATLASAGPRYIVRDDNAQTAGSTAMPFLDKTYTWYAASAAAQRAGTEFCRYASASCSEPDIFIQFNTAVDGPTVLGPRSFHYGYDAPPQTPNAGIDFVATAMHEITHGLGFLSLLDMTPDPGVPLGAKLDGHDDIYADSVVHVQGSTATPINSLTPQQRATALTSEAFLRWADPDTVLSPLNPRREQPFPDNLPPLFAPPTVAPGSTLSHLDLVFFTELMRPNISAGVRSLGLAQPILAALGWRTADTPIPAAAVPYGGQWFDPARGGHGIDLHRVRDTPDTYIAMLYSFDAQGLPEWYIAIGRIVDGVFRPGNDANNNSLWRTRYLFGPPPGQQADASVPGQIRIDFNQAAKAPACNDGTGRNAPLALMTFSLGPDRDLTWCLTQIVPQASRPALDRTGHWFAEGDGGWGVTTLGYGSGNGGLFTIIYYPDSQGRPRWAAAQADAFQSGAVMSLHQIQGYCRTCPRPPGGNPNTVIGEMRLNLDAPAGSPGQIRFNATFNGPGGGNFARNPAALVRLAESAPGGSQP